MPAGPGPIRRAWYEWKMKRFPWRKKWLVGFDLQGNTFWEFKDALHALRNRRIAKYSRSTHYGDVKVSPSWMQWLRHTREHPPTVAEQHQDMMRQERMKLLAAQADARWASKPSALDAPDKQQPMPMLQSRDPDSGIAATDAEPKARINVQTPAAEQSKMEEQADTIRTEAPAQSAESGTLEESMEAPTLTTRKRMKKEPKDSPWKQAAHGNPGQDWQPKGWSPAPAKRRA